MQVTNQTGDQHEVPIEGGKGNQYLLPFILALSVLLIHFPELFLVRILLELHSLLLVTELNIQILYFLFQSFDFRLKILSRSFPVS